MRFASPRLPSASFAAFLLGGVAACVGLVGLTDCAGATAIDIQVYSEVPCATNAEVVLTVADDVASLSGRAPSSLATRCEAADNGTYRRGNVVIVPQDAKDKAIAFQLSTRNDNQPAAGCTAPGATGCIVARRQLRFFPNEIQSVRVDLRLSCLDVQCPSNQTCVKGQCVGSDLVGQCSSGCDEGTLTKDAGVVDAAVEAAPDVTVGDASDAGFVPVEIGAGSGHVCAVVGTNASLRCWGSNDNGKLGDGTTTARSTPTNVNVSGVTQVVGGADSTCALLQNGSVSCWGNNAAGAVGDGTFTERHVPTPVVGLGQAAIALSVGSLGQHHCAILADRTARCWGNNGHGQLGDNTIVNRNAPVVVSGLANVGAIAVGYDFTCAMRVDGAMFCWGNNGSGQLGDGTMSERHLPTAVSSPGGDVAAIGTGSDSTCASVRITNSLALRCWGDNAHGQLGDGTQTQRSLPTPIAEGVDALEIAMSSIDTCVRRSDGAIRCWGENASGQIGNGLRAQRLTPTATVGLGTAAMRLVTASGTTCARLAAATKSDAPSVWCWGSNAAGQLGIGALTPVDSVSPVKSINL